MTKRFRQETAIPRLRRALTWGLGVITLVVVCVQVMVYQAPANNAIDVHIVNLAGRQAMLCQRIAASAMAIHDGSTVPEQEARREMDQALGLFVRTHHALRHGDHDLDLPGDNSAMVEARFAELDPWFRDLTATGEGLLAEPAGSTRARRLLEALMAAERAFLPRMHEIVATYEDEAVAQVEAFRNIETVILALTVISLASIALGVFRPVIAGVEAEMSRRRTAEARLLEQAEELRHSAQAAEAAAQAKARFLASMSHEMRTPLNGIIGMAQVMDETSLDDDQRDHLDVILSSSQTLLALIGDVLDLAKIEEDKLSFEAIEIDVPELARQSLRVVAQDASAKGLRTRLNIDPAIPRRLIGDPTRIRQVLLNLLSNAVKFTDTGQVVLRVLSADDAAGQHHTVRFEIIDTGLGITPDQRAHIFQPFTQADDSTTRRFGGTGLGLTISRRLVAGMGGELDVDSTPGEGSTFHVTLSLRYGGGIPATAESVHDTAPAITDSLSVLLVDDVEINRLVARKLLESLGHDVDEAVDGVTAVSAVADGSFDVVLMDIEMPRLDGVGATRQIRQLEGNRGHVPIVALTANALAGDRERFLAAGLDDYLSKPLVRRELSEVLARVSVQPLSSPGTTA